MAAAAPLGTVPKPQPDSRPRSPRAPPRPPQAFGPFPQPYGSNGCHYTYATAASGGGGTDRWPFGMCTLKSVKDPNNPPYLATSGAQRDRGQESGARSAPACPFHLLLCGPSLPALRPLPLPLL
jgi:hypothetical protein